MPIYEYECPACRKVHDVIQKFADAPLTDCPECKGPVTKLVSKSSFALKGSGWYATDYKKSSAPAPAAAPASEAAAPAKAAEPAAGAAVKAETAPAKTPKSE